MDPADRFGLRRSPILFDSATGWILDGVLRAQAIWHTGHPVYALGTDAHAYRLDPDGSVWSATESIDSLGDDGVSRLDSLSYTRTDRRWDAAFAHVASVDPPQDLAPALPNIPDLCPHCGHPANRPPWNHSRLCPVWRPAPARSI